MHKSKMRGVSLFLGGLLSAVGIGLYGLDDVTDYEQAQANEAFYCSMAAQEAWPRTAEHPCPPQLVEPGAKLARL